MFRMMGRTEWTPKRPRSEADQARVDAGPVLARLDAGFAQLLAPDVGVVLLDLGQLGEDLLALGSGSASHIS